MPDTKDLSYLDLVKACDNFPYYNDLPATIQAGFVPLYLPTDTRPHGYMTRAAVDEMPWTSDFSVSLTSVRLTCAPTAGACTAAFKAVVDEAIERRLFMSVLNATHSEKFSILGARCEGRKGKVEIERFAGDLFGIAARGAHLTVYTRSSSPEETEGRKEMKIWVPRRSADSFTFPNCLDTTVAGGVPSHQSPIENIIQEADEEASLPEELIKRDVRAAGVLTYVGHSDTGFVAPDLVYVYDLEVEEDVVPTPKDGEVKEFYLMGVEEVKTALGRGEFKTNSAVVMVDFFIRHGVITAEEETDYVEICQRMHRRLPFPVTPDGD